MCKEVHIAPRCRFSGVAETRAACHYMKSLFPVSREARDTLSSRSSGIAKTKVICYCVKNLFPGSRAVRAMLRFRSCGNAPAWQKKLLLMLLPNCRLLRIKLHRQCLSSRCACHSAACLLSDFLEMALTVALSCTAFSLPGEKKRTRKFYAGKHGLWEALDIQWHPGT